MLSNFSKTISATIANREKFATFKATYESHRERHLAADRYGASAVKLVKTAGENHCLHAESNAVPEPDDAEDAGKVERRSEDLCAQSLGSTERFSERLSTFKTPAPKPSALTSSSSSMDAYPKGIVPRTCLVSAVKKSKFSEPLTAMLIMSKEKKDVKNDDIFAHTAETFAAAIQAAVTQCMRGEESRKTKDLLSNFTRIVAAVIADKEKFATFKANFNAHRERHLAADRYRSFAVEELVQPTQTDEADDDDEEGHYESTAATSGDKRPDLNLEELIEQQVVKRKRSAGHAKAYEEAEERMLEHLRMALAERDAMVAMEDEPIEEEVDEEASEVVDAIKAKLRAKVEAMVRESVSNQIRRERSSEQEATDVRFARFKETFEAHRQRHSLVTATAHLHTADEHHEVQITSVTAAQKRVVDIPSNVLSRPRSLDLDLEELIGQHVVIVKRKRSAGHAKAYEEAEERMLEHLRMALAERDAMAAMEDEPVEDEVAKEAPEVVDAVMAKLRAKVEVMVRESVADQIRRERTSEQEATDVMVKDILERFS
ncbi:hypothetical protein HDU89_005659 [Geranomyces variabilis]|nr:hypothetical protein HDU89_005659 [Geranomyces variabilis]